MLRVISRPMTVPAERIALLNAGLSIILSSRPGSAGCAGAGMPCTVAGQMGACGMGVTICSGMSTTCQQVNQPRARACNGFDNDCDKLVDED